MSGHSGRNRRRSFLSDPKAQVRLITFFIVLAIVSAALNVYISKCAYTALVTDIEALQMPAQFQSDVNILVGDHEQALNLQLFIITVLMGAMMVLASVAVSRRVGGPMTHLRIYMRGLISGSVEPRRLKFRKNDFFHDVAAIFNDFQEHLGILKKPDASEES